MSIVQLVPTATTRRLSAVAASLAILLAIAGCQALTPAPTTTIADEVTITVPVTIQDKAIISAAADIMATRLRSLGYGTFSMAIGDSIVFTLPGEPVPDHGRIQTVLETRGAVELLPFDEAFQPSVGVPPPATGPPLAKGDAVIASASVIPGAANPGLSLVLGPAATKAVANYSVAHVGGFLLLVVDGSVLVAPAVMGPIPDGRVALTLAQTDRPQYPLDVAAAILDSGPLPAGWP